MWLRTALTTTVGKYVQRYVSEARGVPSNRVAFLQELVNNVRSNKARGTGDLIRWSDRLESDTHPFNVRAGESWWVNKKGRVLEYFI